MAKGTWYSGHTSSSDLMRELPDDQLYVAAKTLAADTDAKESA